MGVPTKDAVIPKNSLTELSTKKHIDFLANYETNKNTKYDYAFSESLRLNGIYWAITALDIMNSSDRKEKTKVRINDLIAALEVLIIRIPPITANSP